eukprot:superscaffoldBa00001066_g8780
MGRYGVKKRNMEGQMVVDFVKRMETAVVNMYFKKREEHRVTYKSGGRHKQLDYVLCRRYNLKQTADCKVVAGENVVWQHRMVVCRMTLETKKKKRVKVKPRIIWWKLKREDCCVELREELRWALGGSEELPDGWVTTAEVVMETARKVLSVSSGQRKADKTWWWNEEVQLSVQRRRLAKKWNSQKDEESRGVQGDVAEGKERGGEGQITYLWRHGDV